MAIEAGKGQEKLACAGISFLEIAVLFRKNRLALPDGSSPMLYTEAHGSRPMRRLRWRLHGDLA
ncbi:MAG: hypothetical protein ABSB19_14750 [Methylomonas sp.]